ncbi:hypothetical protein D3C76_1227670 [compost metagenome]
MRRSLRSGFDGKIGIHAVGIHAKLLTSPLHRFINAAIFVFRHDANMCSYYMGSELNRKIKDSFGFLDLVAISDRILETVSS